MATLMTLAELPADAWPAVTRCLTGADLFQLACISRWSWQCFSQDAYWCDRLALDDSDGGGLRDEGGERKTALELYMRAFSFKFEGLPKGSQAQPTRGVCAPVDQFANEVIRQRQPFAYDVWFCLCDGDSNATATSTSSSRIEMHVGGILLGAQSVAYGDVELWAYYHQQFIVVSSDRTLFCSVINEKQAIASDLELRRWYHLALTYDSESQTQRVYLDGQLVSTLVQNLHSEWGHVVHAQVGTGCITAGEGRFPELQSCGWFPFNGLIDNFRLWTQALTAEDVRALAAGSALRVQARPAYSMKRDLRLFSPQRPGRVGCSRPKEQLVESLYRRERDPA